MNSLQRKLAELPATTAAELRATWRECWRKPAPPHIGPDLLRRGIAWKLQARMHGDLRTSARKDIASLIQRLRNGDPVLSERSVSLRPGTRLVREWRGKTHHVVVLESGFEHEGRLYKSLTQIASAITGVHWSGPAFFGLKKRQGFPRKDAA
jgi:hypothetical protein